MFLKIVFPGKTITVHCHTVEQNNQENLILLNPKGYGHPANVGYEINKDEECQAYLLNDSGRTIDTIFSRLNDFKITQKLVSK